MKQHFYSCFLPPLEKNLWILNESDYLAWNWNQIILLLYFFHLHSANRLMTHIKHSEAKLLLLAKKCFHRLIFVKLNQSQISLLYNVTFKLCASKKENVFLMKKNLQISNILFTYVKTFFNLRHCGKPLCNKKVF